MSEVKSGGSGLPDKIDLHPAGYELDCLLAERVLGATVRRYKEGWSGYENVVATGSDGAMYYIMVSPHSPLEPLWNPSINLSDAQTLLRHLYRNSDYLSMTEEGTDENGYSVTLWAPRPVDPGVARPLDPRAAGAAGVQPGDGREWTEIHSVTGYGPSRALALCRALYKAASDMRPHQVEEG